MEVEGLGATRVEHFAHGGFAVEIHLPESSEALIDELEFDADERLPYWAELWPSARALARYLLDADSLPPRAIELGSGVALPSLALLRREVEVIATDYYDDALAFARHNAAVNGLPALTTELLDWRESPEHLGPFPLIVAADVLYESRNGDALSLLLPQMVSPDGLVIIADPGRVYLSDFMEKMKGAGWKVELLRETLEDSSGGGSIKTTVKLFSLSLPSPDQA